MVTQELTIEIEHPTVDAVSGVWHEPAATAEPRGSAILLAHGAGLPMSAPFMQRMANGLCARGFAVLRFNYPYAERIEREGRRRAPDAAARLEACHRSALAELRRRAPDRRWLLAGKSMGGRISTHLAAKGEDCAGLILFGYPLHPPRRPEKQRHEHFPAIVQPALFLQGTRDALCDLDLLEQALERFGGQATLHVVDGGDHSFAVPKRSGRSADEVEREVLDAAAAWEERTYPG